MTFELIEKQLHFYAQNTQFCSLFKYLSKYFKILQSKLLPCNRNVTSFQNLNALANIVS